MSVSARYLTHTSILLGPPPHLAEVNAFERIGYLGASRQNGKEHLSDYFGLRASRDERNILYRDCAQVRA